MKKKADWVTLLQEANAKQADKIPTGFHPVKHWMDEFRISQNTWIRRIPILIENGQFVRGEYRVIEHGRIIKRPFWKRKSETPSSNHRRQK